MSELMPIERFCAFCGQALERPGCFPQLCPCGVWTYRNPIPVINVLLPILVGTRTGILLIQRGIEPCRGQWALPGGYMELGETWQEGAARELYEETSISLKNPDSLRLLHFDSNRRRDRILFYSLAETLPVEELPEIPVNEEVLAARIIFEPENLAFPPHTEVVQQYFAGRRTLY